MGIRTCPRCSEPLHKGHLACSFCAFTLDDVDTAFGSKRVRLGRLVDASKTINPNELASLDSRMDTFEFHFPQLHFASYIADLPPSVSLRELGFWLINRAIIDSGRENDSLILFCVNNSDLSAGLSLGYVPEQHLSEPTLTSILEATTPYLRERRYAPAIATCLQSISRELRQVPAS